MGTLSYIKFSDLHYFSDLDSGSIVSKDEIMLGVLDHILRAETDEAILAEVADLLFGVAITIFV